LFKIFEFILIIYINLKSRQKKLKKKIQILKIFHQFFRIFDNAPLPIFNIMTSISKENIYLIDINWKFEISYRQKFYLNNIYRENSKYNIKTINASRLNNLF